MDQSNLLMMEDQFKFAYQEWFDRQNESVPEGVWDNVQDQLDIDAAWNTISDRLDQVPATPVSSTDGGWWSALVVGWVAILLLTISFPLNNELPYPDEVLANQSKETQSADAPIPSEAVSSIGEEDTAPASSSAPIAERQSTLQENSTSIIEEPSFAAGQRESSQQKLAQVTLEPESSTTTQSNTDNTVDIASPTQGQLAPTSPIVSTANKNVPPIAGEEPSQLVKLAPFGWQQQRYVFIQSPPKVHIPDDPPFFAFTQVGAIGGIKNTWLLSPETRYGLETNSLIDTRTSWAADVGIRIQGMIKGKYNIGADVLLVSPTRQDYKQYINARYVDRSIALHYQRLHLYYLQPVSGRTQLLFGGYVARLDRASEQVGDDNYVRTDQFKPLDYGLLVGFQQQYPLWNQWSFQVGAQTLLGLPNIYQGTASIPSRLNETREASFSITGGLVYQLKK